MSILLLSCCKPPEKPFSLLIERLQEQGTTASVLATGYSAQVLRDRGFQFQEINPNNIDLSTPSAARDLLVQTIISTYITASSILTDTNHPFIKEVVQTFKLQKGTSHGFYNFANTSSAIVQA